MSREVTANGKRQVVFSVERGFVDRPIQVPCGQCIGCRLEKARQWAVRLTHEAQFHTFRWFLTLTYDDDHLPKWGSLNKAHFQKFMKRLRKMHPGSNIRYMHCGEYGEQTQRPHYHAIVFGFPIDDLKRYKLSPRGDQTWVSPKLDRVWGLGQVIVGSFSYDSAGYVARYVLKKQTGAAATAAYSRVDPETGEVIELQPPYVTMSLKPAIGDTFYKKFACDVLKGDSVVIRGHEALPPKRYLTTEEKTNPDLVKKMKLRRRARAAKHKADSTPERLKVREEVKLAQLKALIRS